MPRDVHETKWSDNRSRSLPTGFMFDVHFRVSCCPAEEETVRASTVHTNVTRVCFYTRPLQVLYRVFVSLFNTEVMFKIS